MPAGCSADGCKSAGGKGSPKLRMVRFPVDPDRRKLWLEIIGRPRWQPYTGARLCEAHFTAEQWASVDRLKADAVPSVSPIFQCTCSPSKVRPITKHDHTYCKEAKISCRVHGHWTAGPASVNALKVLRENCELKETVLHLQKKLAMKGVENKKPEDKKFSPALIRRGLKIRFACGSSGYNAVKQLVGQETRIPSIRVLQQATEHIKCAPGILHEVMKSLRLRFDGLSDERDRDIVLVFDELAIKSRIDYDASLKQYIGASTLCEQEKVLAEKGEVYVFRGCHTKFKQIVAYHLNPSTVNVEKKKILINNLLKEAEEISANVIAIVCDMGNRGLLASLGFSTQKNSLKFCIPNPINPSKKLWCVADPVHVFKSLKECLCSNRFMELPESVVCTFKLPSGMIDVGHIEWLEKFQRDESLHLVPGLTLKDLKCTHFSKMKVKSSYKVVNHKVGASLSYLVLKGLVPPAFEATAWFIRLMNRWFELTTSRSCLLALGLKNEEAYNEALEHLTLVVKVFENLEIPGGWKPVQSHIIFSTKSLLEIQHHLIHERKYQFVFTGNFTSDVVENVMSKVRLTNPMPTALEFKNRLKHLVISNFHANVTSSSYNLDDAEDFVDLLLRRDESVVMKEQQEYDLSSFKWTSIINPGDFKSHVDDVLYRMCGYVIVSLRKRNIISCAGCIEQLRYKGVAPHPNATLMILMDYVPGAQFPVTDILFRLLKLVEFNLIKWAPQLQDVHCLEHLVDAVVKPAIASYFSLQTCHDVKNKIVKAFCIMRFRQLGVHVFSPSDSITSSALSSKTAGGQYPHQ